MKKVLLALAVAALLFSGCKGKETTQSGTQAQASAGTTLSIWNFTNEFENGMLAHYRATHPDVTIEHTFTNVSYNEKLGSALVSGQGAPDLFGLNVDNARTYFESGLLLDITDIYEAYKDKLVKYQVEIGTVNGRVYGLSWQATPGGFYYRRSLAKKYLGSDDPDIVQTYLSDINKFMDTAVLLQSKSGGSCAIISGYDDMLYVFTPNRKQPWIVNGQLTIDPVVLQYLDLCKTMHDKGYEARITSWSENWFNSLKGIYKDERGNQVDVFGYFLPTWGLHYAIKANAPDTSGDWGIVGGPLRYYAGGTFIGAYKNTKNPEAAKELIRYFTADDVFLETWAKESGDFVSNSYVNEKIKNDFSDPFIAGQNHYALFAELAPYVNGTLTQGTDIAIGNIFLEAVTAYANNEKTKDQALADFKAQVVSELSL